MNDQFNGVSVVVAAKNESLHLRESLNSIIKQHGISFELIFVDDNSDDDTFAIASSISSTVLNMRVYKNPSRGKCSAFNYGVSKARGSFICIFAGDDIMPDGSLAARFSAIKHLPEETPGVGLSKLLTMSDDSKFDGHLVPRASGKGALSGVSPLMNRRALDFIFPVPEALPNEDTWMELAILHMPGWNLVHSDIVCCQWRVHAGNSINMTVPFSEYNKKITVRMAALAQFYEKYSAQMAEEQRRLLFAKVQCENKRLAGDWLGVLASRVGLVDRLRALSITNEIMYRVRQRLYGLLSGW